MGDRKPIGYDIMDKTTTKIAAVVVVAIVIIAAVAIVLSNDKSEESTATIDSQLQIRGNANGDYTIDSKDMDILQDVKSGKSKLESYPLADVNNDGKVDDTDVSLLQNLIDRKEGSTAYVICYDTSGSTTTVKVSYPLRNVVTYGTNIQMPALYANGGQYVAGYFNSSYDVAESSMKSTAKDLEGETRKISDASWKNLTVLASEKTLGAVLIDYSGVAQFTSARVADLDAAGIPMIIYPSANASDEIKTVLTLGFLFGGDCEKLGVNYAQASWDVINEIKDKVGSMSSKQTYIALTMYIYICQNDSTFNTSGIEAGGKPYYEVNSEFKSKYAGTGSTKMTSTEALANYTDVNALLNNRSMDWGLTSDEVKNLIVSTWEHSNSGTSSTEFFKGFEEKLTYVNNLLPGAVKVAYMANALYGDTFTESWANSILQKFIDMGTEPLKGQTLDTIVAYFDYIDYQTAKI